MEELLGSEQFYKWSQGKIDIHEKYYYKLKNEQPDWLEFDFKKEGDVIKPQLPTNVIGPEQMDLRFLQFYSPGAAKPDIILIVFLFRFSVLQPMFTGMSPLYAVR
jgi:NTE family protein